MIAGPLLARAESKNKEFAFELASGPGPILRDENTSTFA
jgi:hypothetical protein